MCVGVCGGAGGGSRGRGPCTHTLSWDGVPALTEPRAGGCLPRPHRPFRPPVMRCGGGLCPPGKHNVEVTGWPLLPRCPFPCPRGVPGPPASPGPGAERWDGDRDTGCGCCRTGLQPRQGGGEPAMGWGHWLCQGRVAAAQGPLLQCRSEHRPPWGLQTACGLPNPPIGVFPLQGAFQRDKTWNGLSSGLVSSAGC